MKNLDAIEGLGVEVWTPHPVVDTATSLSQCRSDICAGQTSPVGVNDNANADLSMQVAAMNAGGNLENSKRPYLVFVESTYICFCIYFPISLLFRLSALNSKHCEKVAITG
ncbi:hypothetical protein POM88_009368 [Heracleum sosnowskyi]|uniref:Uncharacterized protein n=1 Tax=Heracleum sosnowskyi TaxID=360622 RepID=A0AAD8JBL0_9APIA|nr:hypothetical protein POM88_009368 [Heracleum sosnowskyi]